MEFEKFNSRLLVIDDDEDILTTIELFLDENFSTIITESNPKNVLSIIKNHKVDIILLDMNFRKGEIEGNEGLSWLKLIKKHYPDVIVILMTAFGDIDLAVAGLKNGAFDFILKPWKNGKLLSTLIAANRLLESKKETSKYKDRSELLSNQIQQEYNQIVGESPAMLQLKETLEKVAPTDTNILLLGENGTGKELAARELHRLSNRANEAFISVDMGSISETLFESELFGHVKGAFTDAKQDKPGRFELANKGTIFLDEIGNLSYKLQAKLLTAIQSKTISRVGSSEVIPFDARLICATNMNLKKMIDESEFRQDLYYRINTLEINIPSLKDRQEDILPLANYFLDKYKNKYNKQKAQLSDKVKKQLLNYCWPGNIRELKNIVERSVILSDGKSISFGTIKSDNTTNSNNLNLEDNEKRLILEAIDKHRGNITKAAKELGIQRNALYRRIEKYGL